MTSASARNARLEARTTSEVQRQVKHAADLQGRSVSDFIVTAVAEAARKAILEAQTIHLSREDQIAIARALIDPPAPTDALRRAARRHEERFGR